ncbi:MAG TPA: serine hydrolase domain-containing protein [Woeseiaceae bacterium]|nr:serine hydrolase domain-containing protein [Woeseiaceae bacterium]
MNHVSRSKSGFWLILVVPLASLCCSAADRVQAPARHAGLRGDLQVLVDERAMPGAVVLIADHDTVVEKVVVGYRDVAESKPMTEDTIFRLYSMSKPITSVAVMILVEDGALALDQPVNEILPEFRHMRVYERGTLEDMVTVPANRPITISDLLTHRSGITYHFTGTTPVHRYYRKYGVLRDTPVGRTLEDGEPAHSLDELVARIAKAPLLHQPGTEFAYSYSTTVLGAVIERVSGKTLDVFLQERIFDPLGMSDTGFFIEGDDLGRFVTNYMMTDSGLREIESPEDSDYRDRDRLLDGGGAIAGTARDYLRFARMLANGGELDGHRLLSARAVKEMFRPHARIKGLGPGADFGFGFAIGDDSTEEADMMPAGTVGWAGSGNTFFWLRPESGNAVVFMTQVITPPQFYTTAKRFRAVVDEAANVLLADR